TADLVLRENRGAGQERLDRRVGNRGDRAVERRAAQPRLEAGSAAALQADLRLAVRAVGERKHVARIDKVRVRDLRVDVPDLGPQPRVTQEHGRDVPERIATLYGVALGGARVDQVALGRRRR